ncbi:MAG: hypothetical protein AAF573_21300, partial [Bacteroidota bacterium]
WTSLGKSFDSDAYIQDLTNLKNTVKSTILIGIAKGRDSYPFFRNDNKWARQLKKFQGNAQSLIPLLESDDLETFYKIFPTKDYGKRLPQRQNLSKTDLAQTDWFRRAIQNCLK